MHTLRHDARRCCPRASPAVERTRCQGQAPVRLLPPCGPKRATWPTFPQSLPERGSGPVRGLLARLLQVRQSRRARADPSTLCCFSRTAQANRPYGLRLIHTFPAAHDTAPDGKVVWMFRDGLEKRGNPHEKSKCAAKDSRKTRHCASIRLQTLAPTTLRPMPQWFSGRLQHALSARRAASKPAQLHRATSRDSKLCENPANSCARFEAVV